MNGISRGGGVIFENYALLQADETVKNKIYTVNVGTDSVPIIATIAIVKQRVFTVTCEKACVVALTVDNGNSYNELLATLIDEEDNLYQFTVAEDAIDNARVMIIQRGDCDCNGVLDQDDSNLILSYLDPAIASNYVFAPIFELAADTNCDNIVNNRDSTRLLRHLNPEYTTNNVIAWKIAA